MPEPSFHKYYPLWRSAPVSARISQITLTMGRISSYLSFVNRAIECLSGGVAPGGCVCRYKGGSCRGFSASWGSSIGGGNPSNVPVGLCQSALCKRARHCILHSTPSFLDGGREGERWRKIPEAASSIAILSSFDLSVR